MTDKYYVLLHFCPTAARGTKWNTFSWKNWEKWCHTDQLGCDYNSCMTTGIPPQSAIFMGMCKKFNNMQIGQNGPLEKFIQFLFLHLNVSCMVIHGTD